MPMSRRKRRAYPSDLTHGQWAVMEPMIPEAAPGGRPRRVPKREIVEAILHLLRAGSHGGRSITICAAGSAKGSGRGFITSRSWRTGKRPA
jgi:hypothetical protein